MTLPLEFSWIRPCITLACLVYRTLHYQVLSYLCSYMRRVMVGNFVKTLTSCRAILHISRNALPPAPTHTGSLPAILSCHEICFEIRVRICLEWDLNYSPFFLSWGLTSRYSLKTARDYLIHFSKRLLVPKNRSFAQRSAKTTQNSGSPMQ